MQAKFIIVFIILIYSKELLSNTPCPLQSTIANADKELNKNLKGQGINRFSWRENIRVDLAEKLPGPDRIKKDYPHNLEDPASPQIFVQLEKNKDRFMVANIDQTNSGKVTLQRVFIEPFEINNEKVDLLPSLDLNLLKKGDVITGPDGVQYQYISVNYNHLNKKTLYLKKIEEETISWAQFKALEKNNRVYVEKRATKTNRSTSRPKLKQIISDAIMGNPTKNVKKVGKNIVKHSKAEDVFYRYDLSHVHVHPKDLHNFITNKGPFETKDKILLHVKIDNRVERLEMSMDEFLTSNKNYEIVNMYLTINGITETYHFDKTLGVLVGENVLLKTRKNTYIVGSGKNKKSIEVYFPIQSSTTEEQKIKELGESLLAEIPENFEDVHARLVFHNNRYIESDRTYATASLDNLTIDFYSSAHKTDLDSNINHFWHELGHMIAKKLWNTSIPFEKWVLAMASDAKYVSQYAQTSLGEDFAETVMYYIKTDAGRLDPGLRKRYEQRFKILDSILTDPLTDVEFNIAYQKTLKKYRLGMFAVPSAAVAGGYVFYSYGQK